jgi:glycosyltransferase involved in cell wall biosynthesis
MQGSIPKRNTMHIALISTACVPVPPVRYGGTELIIGDLANALTTLGHHVTTYATGDSNPSGELRKHFSRAVWPPNLHNEIVHAHYACRDVPLRRPCIDVVHAHTEAALSFAHFIDVPVVYTVHHRRDEQLLDFYQYFSTVEYVMISQRQSETQSEVPNRRVVHHGLDLRRYHLGEGRGGYVAFLGRFAAYKGPHLAIDAARPTGPNRATSNTN